MGTSQKLKNQTDENDDESNNYTDDWNRKNILSFNGISEKTLKKAKLTVNMPDDG